MDKIKRVPGYKSLHGHGHDWFVATPDNAWQEANKRMKRDVERRAKRLATWEAKQTESRTSEGYWDRYDREKYRIPIDYPMPEGHVCFNGRTR